MTSRSLARLDAGVEAIIVHGGGIADVAQHFCNKYEILTIKVREGVCLTLKRPKS